LAWWFKKDSLWYSEFIDAVQDRDIQRTCILQGPVAVRHSKIANEPIGDILGGIHEAIIENLRPQYPNKVITLLVPPSISHSSLDTSIW
jgi:enoyl reductase-like protein